MHAKRIILCGGLPLRSKWKDEAVIRLHLLDGPPDEHVRLRIADFGHSLLRTIPTVYHDLLEIAAYVYAADQAVKRSGQDTDTFGAQWRQYLHFYIPVRCPDFWTQPVVKSALTDVLDFLGDHFFDFTFTKSADPVGLQQYFDLKSPGITGSGYNQVAMFSGGLDSLAGAIDEIKQQRNHVAFVTHIPTSKNIGIIRRLRHELADLAKPAVPLHVGIQVNKAKLLGKEFTQRTRTFLFASLGATVARMLELSSMRFYENGILSLNLPVCAQVVGGRATRTTHPRVLAGFARLFSLISESDFKVTNPYLWFTKAEVIKRIVDSGHGRLIAASISCAHTWERTNQHTHCGTCSQCLDRRVAMLAANADGLDPDTHYKSNIFTESPTKDADRILTATYIERARTLKDIASPEALIARFPEVGRALAYIEGVSPDQAAQRFHDLHLRHGREVVKALELLIARHASDVLNRGLPSDCLIRIVTDSRVPASAPVDNAAPSRPESFFWRRGNVWEIRFRGGKAFPIQKHEKGCAYLSFLLQHRGDVHSIFDIMGATTIEACDLALDGTVSEEELNGGGFAVTYGLPMSDGGDLVDAPTIASFRDDYARLMDELSDAKEFGNSQAQTAVEEKISTLHSRIGRDLTNKGKSRKFQDSRKNQRDALRNSIDRTIAEIRQHDAALADHLADRKQLRLGVENIYQPDAHIDWVFHPPRSS